MARRFLWIAAIGCGGAPQPAAPKAPPPREPVREATVLPREPVQPEQPASGAIRCDAASNADLSVDGLLDDWRDSQIVARAGEPTGALALRCAWDGKSLAFALEVADDRVVRVRGGHAHEDHVEVSVAAKGRPMIARVWPGNSIAPPRIEVPPRVQAADSLQPKGFSVELLVPASAIPDLSPATSELALRAVFHDSDQATGGADHDVTIATTIELAERKELLDDFLATVHLQRSDLKIDLFADLDPDHRGKERLVAGGTVIGVLTEQYAFVTLPAAKPDDILKIELLPFGPRGQQVISAVVRQTGNGGSRDLLMLWTVWSGQLSPLGQIEVRKAAGGNVLESQWKIVHGKKGPELQVTPKPAVGWTAQSWNEEPASDADPIALPWDSKTGGTAYFIDGKDLGRRELPKRRR